MRVLLVESTEGAGEDVRKRLIAEGHEVVECFEAEQHLCVGVDHAERCPFYPRPAPPSPETSTVPGPG